MKIGLLSDTHSTLTDDMLAYFKDCDEIWHAGDIGNEAVAEKLKAFKPLRAVYGNIDGSELRSDFPEEQIFVCDELTVYMIHIGGYPPKYTAKIKQRLNEVKPGLFICGHSHILKVIPDKSRNLLHMNPGAAGNNGFHKVRTMLRFDVNKGQIQNLELIELGKRG
jgi:hypothetical protein